MLAALWKGPRAQPSGIPALQAGYHPNDLLDAAEAVATWPPGNEPRDLVAVDDQLFVAVDSTILALRAPRPRPLVECAGPVTAIARHPDGLLVAAVAGQGIVRIAADGAVGLLAAGPEVSDCVTDLLCRDDGSVLAAVGSTESDVESWSRELLRGRASGAVVSCSSRGAERVAAGLAWPAGLALDGNDVLVSVSHAHQIQRHSLGDGPTAVFVESMPGYPGRVNRHGDRWLVAVPYLRNRGTEFVLADPPIRDRMRELEPSAWLTPRLRADTESATPLQGGRRRVLGQVKSWAPALSYGLAVEFDEAGRAVDSAHSPATGGRHGVVRVVPVAHRRYAVLSRGARAVVWWERGCDD